MVSLVPFLILIDGSDCFSLPSTSFKLSSSLSLTRVRGTSALPVFQISTQRNHSVLFVASRETTSDATPKIPATMIEAIQSFFLGTYKGPICVVGLLTVLSMWRVQLAGLCLVDVVVFLTSVVFWWFQEHILHDKALHSKVDWMGKEIHRVHHEKPYFHISIDPAPLMIGWLTCVHLLLQCILPAPLAVSATIGYAASGLLYEWSHYIVHTRVKPPNKYWKQVRDNHIKHHLVDERYWLSFTVPAVDDLFGTNPPVEEIKREQASAAKFFKKGEPKLVSR